jgi:hypothetical protein
MAHRSEALTCPSLWYQEKLLVDVAVSTKLNLLLGTPPLYAFYHNTICGMPELAPTFPWFQAEIHLCLSVSSEPQEIELRLDNKIVLQAVPVHIPLWMVMSE